MKRLLLLLTPVLFVAACGSNEASYGPLTGTARFVGDDAVDGILELEDAQVRFTETDLAVYQVELVNYDEDQVIVEVRPNWFDEGGVRINDVTRHWEIVRVEGRSRTPYTSVAPSVKAVRCETEIRLHQPIQD